MNPIAPNPTRKKYIRESDDTFKISPGTYRAELKEAFIEGSGYKSKIRFIFEIASGKQSDQRQLAGKTYWGRAKKEFVRDLKSWLSADDAKDILRNPMLISSERLDALVGTKADIVVTHKFNPNYENPFCLIQKIRPSGTLVRMGLN